jgi:hypothetical protein
MYVLHAVRVGYTHDGAVWACSYAANALGGPAKSPPFAYTTISR